MLESINLSLSCACGANCIFCPTNRGKRMEPKIMPLNNAKKIIDELASAEFKINHNVKRIEVGENGDAFLNKDFFEILRYIRLRLPEVAIELFTNFQNFTPDKAEIILKEKLLDSVVCNIDGSNEANYFNVKKLNFANTKKNLSYFIETRKRFNSNLPIRVLVLTLHNYLHTIYNNFKIYPIKLKELNLMEVTDDFREVKKQLLNILDPNQDTIVKSWVIGWAEREKIDKRKINHQAFDCPYLIRIQREAIIAPDGTWYACCLDSNSELVLGNAIKQSINEIYFGPRRQNLLKMLAERRFDQINGPCQTVNCCQIINKHRSLNIFSRLILRHKFLIDIFTRNVSSLSIKKN